MELLNKLHKLGIQLEVENNDLKVKSPKGVLTRDLVDTIKAEKEYLLNVLSNSAHKTIPKAKASDYYPLTSSQNRLWVLSQFEGGNQAYNIPGVFKMTGTLNVEFLTSSFNYLIARHDSLRTSFVDVEGEVHQQVLDREDFIFEITTEEVCESLVQEVIASFYTEDFDLSHAPLLKARLLQTGTEDFYLLFAIHHIIGDGWSMEVFVKELMYVYHQLLKDESIDLPELKLQYSDYSVWIRSKDFESILSNQEAYWQEQLSGELPVLELPSYQTRPLIKTYNGATKLYSFSKAVSDQLNAFSQSQGVTLYMLGVEIE